MKEISRNAICMIVVFVILQYAGAMFGYFPFIANDLAIRAVEFTGLLIAIVVVTCTCWVIHVIQNKNK